VKSLTTQEQALLALVFCLLLLGMAVKAWRTANSLETTQPAGQRPEVAQD
jgi:hypothetical protein